MKTLISEMALLLLIPLFGGGCAHEETGHRHMYGYGLFDLQPPLPQGRPPIGGSALTKRCERNGNGSYDCMWE